MSVMTVADVFCQTCGSVVDLAGDGETWFSVENGRVACFGSVSGVGRGLGHVPNWQVWDLAMDMLFVADLLDDDDDDEDEARGVGGVMDDFGLVVLEFDDVRADVMVTFEKGR